MNEPAPPAPPAAPRVGWRTAALFVAVAVIAAVVAVAMGNDGDPTVARGATSTTAFDRGASTSTSTTLDRRALRQQRRGRQGGEGRGSTSSGNGTTATTVDPGPPPSIQPPTGDPLPLGTATALGSDSGCSSGYSCSKIRVACPGLQEDLEATLEIGGAVGSKRGLVVFMSGGPGTHRWTEDSPSAIAFLTKIRNKGFEVIQLRWKGHGWLAAEPGERAGPARLACRTATAVRWIYQTRYLPMGLDAAPGKCGFCVTGNSGGAAQAAYTVSHYGLESIIDAVIPTNGPTHAALVKGCLNRPGEEDYWYLTAGATIDQSYGFFDKQGPCFNHSASWVPTWTSDAVDTGARDLVHPHTRITALLATAGDNSVADDHGHDWMQRLKGAGSPWVEERRVDGLHHNIYDSPAGLDALEQAILASP